MSRGSASVEKASPHLGRWGNPPGKPSSAMAAMAAMVTFLPSGNLFHLMGFYGDLMGFYSDLMGY